MNAATIQPAPRAIHLDAVCTPCEHCGGVCGWIPAEKPTLDELRARDTGKGPTGPGDWWAFDGETVAFLRAFEQPDGTLAWLWQDMPADWGAETEWTPAWPCAAA